MKGETLSNFGAGYFAARTLRFSRARWRASIMKSPVSPPPLTLHIEPTNHCNLSCEMCFQPSMKRAKGKMNLALYRWIIDQAEGWVAHLQLANFGEPLLHPDLPEMVRYAAKRGFFVELFTNGVLLDDASAKALIEAGTGKINVSIDALDPATYKTLRGTDLEPVLKNLKGLRELRQQMKSKTPFIVLAAADLASNPGEPEKVALRFHEFGADHFYITPSMNWVGQTRDSKSIKPMGQTVRGCLFPWYLMNVSFDGVVTGCCIDAQLGNEIGRVTQNTGNIRDIWNEKKARSLRRALLARDLNALDEISNCRYCSRLYYSQNAYSANRIRVELAQLRHFTGI